jgi:septal ring factor EnvC (AmiA/AmiB activator)
MAEHEELETMRYRVATIEQQLREAMIEANKTNIKLEQQVSYMEENLQVLQDSMDKELSRSYNKGLAKGGTLGFIIGLSVGLLVD